MKAAHLMASGLTACALAALPVAGANAEGTEGWYFGLSGGVSSFDLSRSEIDADVEAVLGDIVGGTSSLDDNDTVWGAVVGYGWRYAAVEVGYLDLGKATYEADLMIEDGGVVSNVLLFSEFEPHGAYLAALGILPVGERFDLFARGGVYFADTTVGTVKASSKDLFVGVGANWNFHQSYALRLDYSRFLDVGKSGFLPQTDVDLISLSILFR